MVQHVMIYLDFIILPDAMQSVFCNAGKWVLLGYAAWTAAALQWYKYNYKRTVM